MRRTRFACGVPENEKNMGKEWPRACNCKNARCSPSGRPLQSLLSTRTDYTNMNGWLIIFAVTYMSSGFWVRYAHSPAALFAFIIFGVLFVLALGARAVRGEWC